MNATFDDIRQWAADRGIYKNGNVASQMIDLIEIFDGMIDGLEVRDPEEIKRTIGDMVVVLVHIAHLEGLTIEQCIDHAYDQIKDRTGRMNAKGAFVKDVN